MNTPRTIKDLEAISIATGIPLEELQEKYGIYEYVFGTAKEAHAFCSQSRIYNHLPKSSKAKAMEKAWRAICGREFNKQDTFATFESTVEFLRNCHPSFPLFKKALAILRSFEGWFEISRLCTNNLRSVTVSIGLLPKPPENYGETRLMDVS